MSRIIAQHQIHADERQRQFHKELDGRHESEMTRAITSAIAQHIQLLNPSIVYERTERQKAIFEIRRQINILRHEVRPSNNDANLRPRDARTDEVSIDVFGQNI